MPSRRSSRSLLGGPASWKLPWNGLLMLVLAAAFLHYAENFPRIFDISLYDETKYMSKGLLGVPLALGNYESSSLYELYYRGVSLFVRDPVGLQMRGGMLIVFLAYLSLAIGVLSLSRNPILTVVVISLLMLSGFFAAEPRLSFLAMAIFSLGSALAFRFDRIAQKAAVLAVTALLASFVRPEFVAAFYLAGGVAGFALLRDALRRWRSGAGTGRSFVRDNLVVILAFAAAAALCTAWSFPVFSGSGRAFEAFGQHYALRYVREHRSAMDPWLLWRDVLALDFPGARTMWEIYRAAPVKIVALCLGNIRDLLVNLWAPLAGTVAAYPLYFAASFAVLAAGVAWRRLASPLRLPAEGRATARRALLQDLALIAIMALPPLLGCILVYPSVHYIVMLEAMGCLLMARAARESAPVQAAPLAIAVAVGLLAVVRPLPPVAQPVLQVIEALRRLPPITGLVEADGGWCIYLRPHCTSYSIAGLSPSALSAMLGDGAIDAVMASPRLRGYETYHPHAALAFLALGGTPAGWRSYPLPEGYSIFYRLPAAGAPAGGQPAN